MSRFRIRFTMRRLIIMVAIIACAIGGERMRRQRRALNSMASFLASHANRELEMVKLDETTALSFDAIAAEQQGFADRESNLRLKQSYQRHVREAKGEAEFMREEAQEFRDDAIRHSRLARKFQRAASRPWQWWRSVDPELKALTRID